MKPFLGVLDQYLCNDDISEVMVVQGTHIWIEDSNGIRCVAEISSGEIQNIVEQISRLSARRIDTMSPILDAVLPDGSRACVVIAPIAVGGTSVNIRKFPQRIFPVAAFGSEVHCQRIRNLVRDRANVVVSGATSSGKTSLISAVTHLFNPHDRVVCVEDTAEIRSNHQHFVRLQTRRENIEGNGAIHLQQLVHASLRMRPDRLVVGEVRGGEVVDMLLALSSGHSGSWTTVHAQSAQHTPQRLVSLLLRHQPQWNPREAEQLVRSAIDAIVHIVRLPTGKRMVSDVMILSETP